MTERWVTPTEALEILLAAHEPQELGRSSLHELLVAAALDVQAQQRFRVRCAQVEAPIRELDAETVGVIHAERAVCVGRFRELESRGRILDLAVDLAACGKPLHSLPYERG